MNIINTYCHWKIELIGKPLGEKKCHNLKNVDFGKKCPKIKKIETSWAKKVIKLILETENVIEYIWFIHYLIKKFKNMQCKKE